MALLSLTINNASPALDKKAQEVQLISRGLDLAQQAICSSGGTVTSGNILDTGGVTIGSWTYTAQAAS